MKPVTSKSSAVSSENDCTALALPQIPRAVRYWDDFEETYRILNLHESSDHFIIHDDGEAFKYELSDINAFSRAIALGIVGQILTTDDPSSATAWISHFLVWARKMPPQFIQALARKKPFEIQGFWTLEIVPSLNNPTVATCVRKVLHYFCRHHVGDWSPDYHHIVSRLPGPKVDPFAVARGGECFIPVSDQQVIYDFLDDTCEALASGKKVGTERLVDATAMIFADQHAFRPGTIARIRIVDVRIHNTGAIHVASFVIKKHQVSQRVQITRRIKADWAPIVCALVDRTKSQSLQFKQSPKLLGLTPKEIGKRIADRTQMLTGTRWTATDFRHTAAQRQVDLGASADQLADFMQHNNTLVGNVYFDQSPNQAKLVNDALAASQIYSVLPEIHKTKTIDKRALMGVPEDRQIGAMPHGVPIAGIGACESPQSLCQKNPVLSCYGCRKFLAVADVKIHELVVSTLRNVVMDFFEAGLADERSPAYLQLRHTIAIAQAFVDQFTEQPS